jgi:hypothetical protein
LLSLIAHRPKSGRITDASQAFAGSGSLSAGRRQALCEQDVLENRHAIGGQFPRSWPVLIER